MGVEIAIAAVGVAASVGGTVVQQQQQKKAQKQAQAQQQQLASETAEANAQIEAQNAEVQKQQEAIAASQKKAEEARIKQIRLDAERSRRRVIREAIVTRGAALGAAGVKGVATAGTSSVVAGQQQVTADQFRNLSTINTALEGNELLTQLNLGQLEAGDAITKSRYSIASINNQLDVTRARLGVQPVGSNTGATVASLGRGLASNAKNLGRLVDFAGQQIGGTPTATT